MHVDATADHMGNSRTSSMHTRLRENYRLIASIIDKVVFQQIVRLLLITSDIVLHM